MTRQNRVYFLLENFHLHLTTYTQSMRFFLFIESSWKENSFENYGPRKGTESTKTAAQSNYLNAAG